MIIAISQPTFLPYGGYFALIESVEQFIFLDDVQFDKRSWQQRNILSINGKPKFITIPVETKNKFNQNINSVKIDYKHFNVEKFLKTIELNYKKEPFFDEVFHEIKKIFLKRHEMLSELNIELIKMICIYLGINTSIILSSNFKKEKKLRKTELLLFLLNKFNCSQYYTTFGSKNYLGEMNIFPGTKIGIKYFYYSNSETNVKKDNQDLNLSTLDLMFRYGSKTKEKIIKNFKLVN